MSCHRYANVSHRHAYYDTVHPTKPQVWFLKVITWQKHIFSTNKKLKSLQKSHTTYCLKKREVLIQHPYDFILALFSRTCQASKIAESKPPFILDNHRKPRKTHNEKNIINCCINTYAIFCKCRITQRQHIHCCKLQRITIWRPGQLLQRHNILQYQQRHQSATLRYYIWGFYVLYR